MRKIENKPLYDFLISDPICAEILHWEEDFTIDHFYAGDLMSDVLANIGSSSCILTMMAQENTLAVAQTMQAPLVILANNSDRFGISGDSHNKKVLAELARTHCISLCISRLSLFELSGLFWQMTIPLV